MLALRAFRPAVAATRMAPRMAPVARPLGLRFHSGASLESAFGSELTLALLLTMNPPVSHTTSE